LHALIAHRADLTSHRGNAVGIGAVVQPAHQRLARELQQDAFEGGGHPTAAYPPRLLVADGEAGEAAYDHVLACGRRELVAQRLHRLALDLGVVHLLLEQDHRLIPGVQLAGDDPLAHVLRLALCVLFVDPGLRVARIGGDVVATDIPHARGRRDLHGHGAGESNELVVVRHEVCVAVHLNQHPHLCAGVDVGLHGALGGGALAEVLDLLALLHAQDLDRLLHVPPRLGERPLAIHHARAGALAQRLHLLGADLCRAHDFPPFAAPSPAGSAAAFAASPAAASTGAALDSSPLAAGAAFALRGCAFFAGAFLAGAFFVRAFLAGAFSA